MSKAETTVIQTEIPKSLVSQAQKLLDAGWFRDFDDLFLDALRRFLESHRENLLEEFVHEDVEWGLTGDD
jgi:Arc/MetJ-type ribon-helix-helix transcriptional regulator